MDTEDSPSIVERPVPVPMTGASVNLDLPPLAHHGDGGPVGADRHLSAHIEPALLTALAANIKQHLQFLDFFLL